VKRIVLWFMSTLTVVTLLFGYSTSTSGPGTATSVLAQPSTDTGTASGAGSGTASGTDGTDGSSGSAASPSTVTGTAAGTRWGPVQVRLTVDGDTITDVTVVEYPTGNGKDRQINARAIPVLVRETLDAQSADIDMVSGATVTSEGYLESLQAALDEAGL
jgi:uncharacterized protein with FMN-binding domain